MHLRSAGCWLAVVLIGCASSAELDSGAADFSPEAPSQNTSAGGSQSGSAAGADTNSTGAGGSTATGATPAAVAPEQEVENSFRVPVVTGSLIWAANPVSGRVALVNAETHQVQTLPAGLQPTYLAAIPGTSNNRALVLNSGSTDATLFRQAAGGALSQLQIPVHQNANSWAISDDGRWAIAWSDATEFPRLDPTEGLQDVTVLDLSADKPAPARFSVGYRPVKLQIDAGGARVYAVTHDGISVIELGTAPHLADDISILSAADAISDQAGEPVLDDVPITRNGRFAVVRFAGAPRLQVLDLQQRTSQVLELPSEASDVDLAGDGERAVAVLRESAQVAVFDPAVVIADPSQVVLRSFTGETLGSVALPEQGDTALLFTNATASDRLAILNLADAGSASPRVVSLKAPVQAVFPTPEGSYAVALLDTDAGSDRAGAFSVVPVAEALPAKIQGTDAPPYRVALAQTLNGLRGLVTTRDDVHGIHAAYLVRMPSLQVDRIDLSSPPIAVGVLPALGVGYVAQQHPEGRITFINLETGAPETLTGFELADRVVNGDSP